MKKIFFLLAASLLAMACSNKRFGNAEIPPKDSLSQIIGDSTIYGLACEGCTDSILVFMDMEGNDPDTIDILRALLSRKLIGRPRIGDNMAVILNPENKREALCVINVDKLKGTWAYQVFPTYHHRPIADSLRKNDSLPPIPDSIMKKIMVPREYGFTLKRNHAAQPLGLGNRRNQNDERNSRVRYPRPTFYTEWHLFNGKLILTQEARGDRTEARSDTAEILSIRRDTLKLKFGEEIRTYYKKNKTEGQ